VASCVDGAASGREISADCEPSNDGVDCSCFVEPSISTPSSMVSDVRYVAQNSQGRKCQSPVKSNKERAWSKCGLQQGWPNDAEWSLTIRKQDNDTEGLASLVEMNECPT
jgi:hypothetical protein